MDDQLTKMWLWKMALSAPNNLRGARTEPVFFIDTAAINRKYARRRNDSRRTWTGVTTLDAELSGSYLSQALHERCARFIDAMAKRRWDVVSKLVVKPNGIGHDIDTGAPLLNTVEYKIVGVFRMADVPKPIRDEVPSGLVKKEVDQTLTLADARKAL